MSLFFSKMSFEKDPSDWELEDMYKSGAEKLRLRREQFAANWLATCPKKSGAWSWSALLNSLESFEARQARPGHYYSVERELIVVPDLLTSLDALRSIHTRSLEELTATGERLLLFEAELTDAYKRIFLEKRSEWQKPEKVGGEALYLCGRDLVHYHCAIRAASGVIGSERDQLENVLTDLLSITKSKLGRDELPRDVIGGLAHCGDAFADSYVRFTVFVDVASQAPSADAEIGIAPNKMVLPHYCPVISLGDAAIFYGRDLHLLKQFADIAIAEDNYLGPEHNGDAAAQVAYHAEWFIRREDGTIDEGRFGLVKSAAVRYASEFDYIFALGTAEAKNPRQVESFLRGLTSSRPEVRERWERILNLIPDRAYAEYMRNKGRFVSQWWTESEIPGVHQ